MFCLKKTYLTEKARADAFKEAFEAQTALCMEMDESAKQQLDMISKQRATIAQLEAALKHQHELEILRNQSALGKLKAYLFPGFKEV